ncbi:hypothetical protein CLV71_13624 [Actinophytocola oryzae]|uniref:Uncharacterized protein n=1 Tax=Actinophytocola oryzae TaxID=502181 RepID=A0A4R7URT1_9PSEU|nr:hypothetical protein [Actinophytocola oryzae]TDV35309.1 hypothetical protein CLV71_13624 [Actinophytocola oryzae]
MWRSTAVTPGRTSRHSAESSQDRIDSSAGTAMPISWVAAMAASAMTSLSKRMAVGRSRAESSLRAARAPPSPVSSACSVLDHASRCSSAARVNASSLRAVCVNTTGPAIRAMRRWPSAAR